MQPRKYKKGGTTSQLQNDSDESTPSKKDDGQQSTPRSPDELSKTTPTFLRKPGGSDDARWPSICGETIYR